MNSSDSQELSAPEETSYMVAGDNKPRERRWTSRSGAPGWAADKRGHYRDQHQPEESDVDLLMEQGHDNSTRIMVKFILSSDEGKCNIFLSGY